MGGPSSQQTQTQSNIQQQQLDLAQQQETQANANQAQSNKLLAPLENFNTAVTSSPAALNSAAAPLIGNVSQATRQTQEQIRNTIPAGPGQQVALAEAASSGAANTAAVKNSTYTNALNSNASIASGLGGLSLQEIGASLSGLNSGSATGQNILNTQTQAKAATDSLFGSLAGAAGGAVSGFNLGGGGAGSAPGLGLGAYGTNPFGVNTTGTV